MIGDLQRMEGKRAARAERREKGRQPMDESGLLLTVGLDDEEDEVVEEEEVDGEEKEVDTKLMVCDGEEVEACGCNLLMSH